MQSVWVLRWKSCKYYHKQVPFLILNSLCISPQFSCSNYMLLIWVESYECWQDLMKNMYPSTVKLCKNPFSQEVNVFSLNIKNTEVFIECPKVSLWSVHRGMLLKCLDTAMVGKTIDWCMYLLCFLMALKSRTVFFRQSVADRLHTHKPQYLPAKMWGKFWVPWGWQCIHMWLRDLRFRGPTSIPIPTVPFKIEAFSVYAG